MHLSIEEHDLEILGGLQGLWFDDRNLRLFVQLLSIQRILHIGVNK